MGVPGGPSPTRVGVTAVRSPLLERRAILEALRAAREGALALARARRAGAEDPARAAGVLMRGAWADMERAHAKLQEALRRARGLEGGWAETAEEVLLLLGRAMGRLLSFLREKGVAV